MFLSMTLSLQIRHVADWQASKRVFTKTSDQAGITQRIALHASPTSSRGNNSYLAMQVSSMSSIPGGIVSGGAAVADLIAVLVIVTWQHEEQLGGCHRVALLPCISTTKQQYFAPKRTSEATEA